MALDKARDY